MLTEHYAFMWMNTTIFLFLGNRIEKETVLKGKCRGKLQFVCMHAFIVLSLSSIFIPYILLQWNNGPWNKEKIIEKEM